MKILYCGVASKYIHTVPAGWFLAEYLKSKGIVVDEMYRNVNEPLQSVQEDIVKRRPDVLLLSVYIFNVVFLRKLVGRLRAELPGLRIVAGGPEADGTFPTDHTVFGEGEKALYALIQNGFADANVYEAPVCALDELPSPYTPDRLALARGKLVYYESSRGCPFACSYCMAGMSRGVRYAGIDRVQSDLKAIVAADAKTVKFTDRTFNANAARAEEILSFIRDAFGTLDVRFHFEVGGDLFRDGTIRLLNSLPAGLVQLEAGVQTLNPESLNAINRVFDPVRFKENIRRILAPGNIHVHLDLIAGLPCDTLQTFTRSFDEVYALRPQMLQLGFLKFLKGTPIRETYDAQYSPEPPYEVLSTPSMSLGELELLRRVERVFDKLYNGGRFFYTLEYLTSLDGSPFATYRAIQEHLEVCGVSPSGGDAALAWALVSYRGGLPAVKELLRLDAACLSPLRKTPSFLKRPYSDAFRAFTKNRQGSFGEFGSLPGEGEGLFFVEFDYSAKDKITGRYPYRIVHKE